MTNKVAVVLNGSSDAGLAAARILGRDQHVMLSDPNPDHLHRALDDLDSRGISAESVVADVTDRRSIEILMMTARTAGTVGTVVQPLGHSPRANSVGLLNVSRATLAVASEGTTLIQAASGQPKRRSIPAVSKRAMSLAATDPESFMTWLGRVSALLPARIGVDDLCSQFALWHHVGVEGQFNARGASLVTTFADRVQISSGVGCATGGLIELLAGFADTRNDSPVAARRGSVGVA